MSLVLVALLSAPPAGAPPVAAGDWPWWRGPSMDAHSEGAESAPVEWSKRQNVLWRAAFPGLGHSSPVVAGDLVVYATGVLGRHQQGLVALDRKTGAQRWGTVIFQGGFPAQIHPANTHASATPAWDGTHFFANFYSDNAIQLAALDAKGKVAWKKKAGSYIPRKYQFGFGASPLLYDAPGGPLVIVAGEQDDVAGSWLRAFDRKTGRRVWEAKRAKTLSFSSPILAEIDGASQLLITGGGTISSFDPATGKSLWSAGPLATATCGTVVTTTVGGRTLAFGSGGYPEQATIAADVKTGEVVWRNATKCYEQSLLVSGDGTRVYGVNEAGVLICWDAATGKENFKKRIGGGHSASPVLVGDRIYVTNEAGETVVFKDAGKYEELARNQLGQSGYATLAPVGDTIYYRTFEGGSTVAYALKNGGR